MASEAESYSIALDGAKAVEVPAQPSRIGIRLLELGPIRWFLQGLYNRLFRLLSHSGKSASLPEESLISQDTKREG